MSAAQLLIGVVGLGASFATFILMRFPEYRRQQYLGAPFSTTASAVTALLVLTFCLACVWAQGRFEAR